MLLISLHGHYVFDLEPELIQVELEGGGMGLIFKVARIMIYIIPWIIHPGWSLVQKYSSWRPILIFHHTFPVFLKLS